MTKIGRFTAAAFVLSLIALGSFAVVAAQDKIEWQKGPIRVDIESHAEVTIPQGYIFTGKEGTMRAMKLMGNLLTNKEVGMIAPASLLDPKSKDRPWFVVFEYDPIGYVKDDEKNNIDANSLLETFRENNRRANVTRAKEGLQTLEVAGWAVRPHYDQQTHNLEWGLELKEKQGEVDIGNTVNYEVRLLGRTGVMSSTLVLSREDLNTILPEFRKLLKSYEFKSGMRYAEFKQGDKIAQYGLTALIGGGAVAVAAKSGLLKHLWKVLVAAAVGVGALLRRLWGRKE